MENLSTIPHFWGFTPYNQSTIKRNNHMTIMVFLDLGYMATSTQKLAFLWARNRYYWPL